MYRLLGVLFLVLCASPLLAEGRVYLGMGGLSSNDAYGDFQDRWQTASRSHSFVFGPEGTVSAPADIGAVLELRSGFQVITPDNTMTPAPGDRPVVGVLRSGVHTHFSRLGAEFVLGAGVEAMGPATQVTALQDRFHATLGFDQIAAPVLAAQMGNKLRPMLGAEAAWSMQMDPNITFRPFAELRAGLESYGRIGADLLIGDGFGHGLLGRDYVTGQPYKITDPHDGPSVSLLLGADTAAMLNSQFLPAATPATTLRTRIRAGMMVEDSAFSFYYGATYLTPEFQGQPSGQLLGSMQIKMRF
ncbi:MAG: lipid A-modifier LpxR family protein [Maritimibacter sp.]